MVVLLQQEFQEWLQFLIMSSWLTDFGALCGQRAFLHLSFSHCFHSPFSLYVCVAAVNTETRESRENDSEAGIFSQVYFFSGSHKYRASWVNTIDDIKMDVASMTSPTILWNRILKGQNGRFQCHMLVFVTGCDKWGMDLSHRPASSLHTLHNNHSWNLER